MNEGSDSMNDGQFDGAVSIINGELKNYLENLPYEAKKDTYEIRMRRDRPLILYGRYGSVFVGFGGGTTYRDTEAYRVSPREFDSVFSRLCDYSVHTHLPTLIEGYITMKTGHRVGVACTAVTNSSGEVTSVKDISSLNIRICREKQGCADEIINEVFGGRLQSVIIAGPPLSGKTTVLRDLIRQLSGPTGQLYKVCLVDERYEIAGMCDGVPTYDIGLNCDVLSAFPKGKAVINLIKTMSPDVIAIDEVATQEEISAIGQGVNSGVKFIVTVHASNYDEIIHRPQIAQLIDTYSFSKLILLGDPLSPSRIKAVFDIKELRDEIFGSGTYLDNDGFDWDNGIDPP